MRLIMTDGIGKVPQDGPMQTVCLTSRDWKDTNMVCLCLPHKDSITSMPYPISFLLLADAFMSSGVCLLNTLFDTR